MIDTEFLRQLFPRTEEIPLEHRPPAAIHQRRVLINGELRSWQGSCQTVVSPVGFRNTAEVLEQVELGSYPEGSELRTTHSRRRCWRTTTAVVRGQQ